MHFAVQTSYSPFRSTLDAARAVYCAARDGHAALGIADTSSLAAAPALASAAREAGVLPVAGLRLPVRIDAQPTPTLLTLLATDREGWQSLLGLCEAQALSPGNDVTGAQLADNAAGLFAITGAPDSPTPGRDADTETAAATTLADIYGPRLGIEIVRTTGRRASERVLDRIARALDLPLFAASPARCASPAETPQLKLLDAIGSGRRLADPQTGADAHAAHLKSTAEMAELFADAPALLDNLARLRRRIDDDTIPGKSKPRLPRLHASPQEEAEHLTADARAGLAGRFPTGASPAHHDRLESELRVIIAQGFAGYFLIVADFIAWARGNGIAVGPGRGSGAGSLVAYALGITALDPLAHGLLFERFINPERVSLPDFDIDFQQDGRERVIDYVRQRYGARAVAGIGTSTSWHGRAAFRDAARALGLPQGLIDRTAALLPQAGPVALDALDEAARAQLAAEPDAMRALTLALPLQGLIRQRSRHAAGIIISDQPIGEQVPLMRDPGGGNDLVTQYDMKAAEDAGLVKFDFLGLKTLDLIEATIAHIRAEEAPGFGIERIPAEDPATFTMLQAGHTGSVFQLESSGIVQALKEIRPTRFADLVALVALYRPGPMAFIPDYAARKAGREAVIVPHPHLETLLAETHGILVYQEQIIELAQIMAGFTKGGADLLRRAVGKKLADELAAQRSRFIAGCLSRGHDHGLAEHLWSLIERFASYGFNKSHAAAYATITWQTAWLKCRHPAAFTAAAMTLNACDAVRLRQLARDAAEAGVTILPPMIGDSNAAARPVWNAATPDSATPTQVRLGLGAIKGLGDSAARATARLTFGRSFADIPDLARTLADAGLTPGQARLLGQAGALDHLHANRTEAGEHLALCLKAEAPGTAGGPSLLLFALEAPRCPSLEAPSREEMRQTEEQLLGLAFSRHPLETFGSAARRLGCEPLKRLAHVAGLGSLDALVMAGASRNGQLLISDPDTELLVGHDLDDPPTPGTIGIATLALKTAGRRAQLVRWRDFDPARAPQRLRLRLAQHHDWAAILNLLTAAGRGDDRADITVSLGDKGQVRRALPSCLRLDSRTVDLLAARNDVEDAQLL